MKKCIYTLLCMLFLMPINIYAFELSCDDSIHNHGDNFKCVIKGSPDDYESISGSISNDRGIECELESHDGTLEEIKSDKKSFEYTGSTDGEEIVTFNCKVTSTETVAVQTRAYINNFKYKRKDDTEFTELVLRSDSIQLGQYVDPDVDTKPRNTDKPDSVLKKVEIDKINFTFSRFNTIYDLNVLFDVDKINIKYTPLNLDATVKVEGDTNLKVGKNVIDIYVTSPDYRYVTCYTFNITRLAKGEAIYEPSQDSSLKALTITGFTLNFDPEKREYDIHLTSKQDKVIINATPNYQGAVVSPSKTTKLVHGDIIVITVISEDGTNKTEYKIHVTKDAEKKDYSAYFILGGFVIAIIAIIVLVLFTNSKKIENDPVLSLKKKKKQFKGFKLNKNDIPDVAVPVGNEVSENNTENTLVNQNMNNLNQTNVVTQNNVVEQVQPVQATPVVQQQVNVPVQPVEQVQPVEPVMQQQPIQPVMQQNNAGVLPSTPTSPVLPQDQANNQNEDIEFVDL